MFAIQMIRWFNKIFESADLKLYMRPYNILITSANSGILGILLTYLRVHPQHHVH